ncbi:threonine/serine exporter family protein, partial [Phenylobacterium sp.]
ACLTVGLVLTPIANRLQMPFAAVGFASVVSMMPGVFLFRMASGLVQIAGGPSADPSVIGETLSNAATAATIVLAMSLGLLTPKLLIDGLGERARRRAP